MEEISEKASSKKYLKGLMADNCPVIIISVSSLLSKGGCFSPHQELCCMRYGVYFMVRTVLVIVHTHTPLQLTPSFPSLPFPRFPSQAGFLIFVFLSQQFLHPRKYSSLEAWQLTLRSNPASRTWTTFALSGAHGYGPNWKRDLKAGRWRKFAKRWGLLYRRLQRQLDQSEMESISISMGE